MHTYMYDWGEPERAPHCRVVDCGRVSMHVCTVCTCRKYVILNISQLNCAIVCMHATYVTMPGKTDHFQVVKISDLEILVPR